MSEGRETPISTSALAGVGMEKTSANPKSNVPESNLFILHSPLSIS
jgi:hypothetical protein